MLKKLLHVVSPLLALALFCVALVMLRHELRQHGYHQILDQLHAIANSRVACALGLTAAGYFCLTLYDFLAFKYIDHPLHYRRIALTSFIGYAFSHNIGLSFLSGGSVRYRLYSSWGLSGAQITRVVLFCTFTFSLGFLALAGTTLLIHPIILPEQFHVQWVPIRAVGAVLLVLLAAYFVLCATRNRPLRFSQWEIALPDVVLAMEQVAVSVFDWLLAAGAMYVLLPGGSISFTSFLAVFMVSTVVGIVSHVPGGLGVFETVLLLFLSPRVEAARVLGAMVVFRVVYYLLPLAFAAVALVTHEIATRRHRIQSIAQSVGDSLSGIVPHFLAVTTFIAGVILLISGATPPARGRIHLLTGFLPVPVIEISHFFGSLAGLALLLLARGIQRRLDAAYHLTAAMLSAGIAFSLLKAFDWEEAVVLSLMLAALLPCRRHFYRRANLTSEPFTIGWIVTIAIVLAGAAWLGFFSHRHHEISGEVIWRMLFEQREFSRFLRAMVGIVGAVLVIGTLRLLSPAPPDPQPPTPADLDVAAPIIARSRWTAANLALLGDKTLLFSRNRQAVIAYAVAGRTWVAMGDPAGEEQEFPELIWDFRELVDRHGGWPAFYQVRSDNLHLYLDLGLSLLKLGEEARVPLADFCLDGGARKSLRQCYNRVQREGLVFEIVPSEGVAAILPELRAVSDAWLDEKKTREKGFSLGYFDEEYLTRCPCAIVRQDGRIIAFANIWAGAQKHELSVDLMRFVPGAHAGVMDYVFTSLMLWGKEQGYAFFSLGMAPLAGLQDRALAPLWTKVGAMLFRHANDLYNFQGLREYKAKFDPKWEPRYLACPAGLALPVVLTNIAALISGGVKGMVRK